MSPRYSNSLIIDATSDSRFYADIPGGSTRGLLVKLGLGTAQFGLNYGVTNTKGRTPVADVSAILGDCSARGVDILDTAALYGESESVLGRQIPRPHGFRIIGKTINLDSSQPLPESLETVRSGVFSSLTKLGESKLHGLLVHKAADLLGPSGDALFKMLVSLREAGLVDKIGASVYAPEETAILIERYPLEIVQFPLNVFDQRMMESGMLSELRQRDVEIHVRSAFLQGVLLIDNAERLPQGLLGLTNPLQQFRDRLRAWGISPLAGALAFLKSLAVIDVVLCGVTSLSEWLEIAEVFGKLPDLSTNSFKDLAQSDVNIIDPRLWRQ